LAHARETLEKAGFESTSAIFPGEPEGVLTRYQQENNVGMMIMGTYGNSRIRQLLVGSTTTEMIRNSTIPLLLR
jgi:nucleotide-binding universal stress UspA family protein